MAIPTDIIEPLKTTLEKAQDILVLMPQNAGQEMVAGALGLYQVLSEAGKSVVIACPTKISESSRSLNGGDQVALKIGNRNLVISLKVNQRDSIDKVSYNLDEDTKTFNLIIQPKKGIPPLKREDVSYTYSGARADLIITVGANRLEDLGDFYEAERKLFTDAPVVSLHRFPTPTFADYQIIDPDTSGFGELAYELVQELGLSMTVTAATNFLAGLDIATNNLQNGNLKPDTLEHMAQLLRAGGVRRSTPAAVATQPASVSVRQSAAPAATVTVQPQNSGQPQPADVSPVASQTVPANGSTQTIPQDWLAPKIYKSSAPVNQ